MPLTTYFDIPFSFQFEEGVLDAAIYCLARACNSRYGRTMSDPVRVSRALSKIVSDFFYSLFECFSDIKYILQLRFLISSLTDILPQQKKL